ncbi:DNA-binding protein [Inconstantimicrobium porci]|uniref:DNA-binding protein n=1 Tax=Inconstantimicrobium porci TaxID=2652291 RepID=UPI001F25EDE1|nr:DNA-binding protein [Inconstantimicrobium porci]
MNGYLKISEISKNGALKRKNQYFMFRRTHRGGIVKFGNTWAIPENAEKPKDERIKTGKYIKNKSE